VADAMPGDVRLVRLDGGDDRFAPFGTIFPAAAATARTAVPLRFAGEPSEGTETLTVIQLAGREAVGALDRVEHHPFSVQAFVPLAPVPLLCVVAPCGAPPSRPDELTAFAVPAGYGLAYRTGVWHGGLMSASGPATAVSYVRRMADGRDTEFAALGFRPRLVETDQ
jgi:ureidoglycolate hydrolase